MISADPGDRVEVTGAWTVEGVPSPTVTATLRQWPDGTPVVLPPTVDIVDQVVTVVATYDVPRLNTAAGVYSVDFVCTGNPIAVGTVSFWVRRSEVLV